MLRCESMNWSLQANQGWKCPVCGKVHAPWVDGCDCHRVTTNGTSTGKTESVSVHIPHSLEEWMEEIKTMCGGEDA